jgi:hypothetical protein
MEYSLNIQKDSLLPSQIFLFKIFNYLSILLVLYLWEIKKKY